MSDAYQLYGVGISGRMPFSTRLERSRAPATVEVRWAELDFGVLPAYTWVHPSPEIAQYNYDDALLIEVSEGREIALQALKPLPDEVAMLPVLGGAMGHLMHQRGALVLHGNTVQTPHGCVLFVGPRGAGKSTAAAALLAYGQGVLVSEDVAVIGDASHPTVEVGERRMRLWPDSAEALGHDVGSLPLVHPDQNKVWVDCHETLSAPPTLTRVYLVQRGEKTEIRALTRVEALMGVMGNHYAARSLCAEEGARLMTQSTALICATEVVRLIIADDLKSLPALAEVVNNDLRGRG